jgi:hypothetical protein
MHDGDGYPDGARSLQDDVEILSLLSEGDHVGVGWHHLVAEVDCNVRVLARLQVVLLEEVYFLD